MRALFWRRKNARLAARLNTVIEKSEEVRKSYRPAPPRVIIDTSYVDQLENDDSHDDRHVAGDADGVEDGYAEAEASGAATVAGLPESLLSPNAGARGPSRPARLTSAHTQEAAELNAPAHAGIAADDLLNAEEQQELVHLLEALEAELQQEQSARLEAERQLEELGHLEAEAQQHLAEVKAAAADAQQELAALRQAIDKPGTAARREAEARQRELAALKEVEEYRERIARLENEMHHEQFLRREAEARREETSRRAAELEGELAAARTAAQSGEVAARIASEARQKDLEAQKQIETHKSRADRLEVSLQREQQLRREAETQRDEASTRAVDALRELAEAHAAAELAAADLLKLEARYKEQLAEREAKSEREFGARIDAETGREKSLRAAAERQRDDALEQAAKIRADLAAAQQALEREIAEHRKTESHHRDELARKLADAGQEESARLKAEMEVEKTLRRAAEARLEQALRDVEGLKVENLTLTAAINRQTSASEETSRLASEIDIEKALRRAAEAKFDQAQREIKELKEEVAALTASIDREILGRREAESRQQDVLAASETNSRLSAEMEAEKSLRRAVEAKLAELQREAGEVKADVAKLRADLDRERAALHEVAAERDAARRETDTAHAQLHTLRQTSLRDLSQQGADAASLGEIEAKLKADLQNETLRRVEAESDRDEAVRRAEALERELAVHRDGAMASESALPPPLTKSAPPPVPAPNEAREAPRALPGIIADDSKLSLSQRLQQAAAATQPLLPEPPASEPEEAPRKSRRSAEDLAAAQSVSGRVPMRAKTLVVVPAEVEPAESAGEPAQSRDGIQQRRDKRVSAQTPATVWAEGMMQALNCTIRDKSASGALLEFPHDRFKPEITEISVGDKITLTINIARERTSVLCEVKRIKGRRCGVRFCGPFQTEVNKPKKSAVAPSKAGAGR